MTDYDIVRKSWELAKALNLSKAQATKHMRVSTTAFSRWLEESAEPHPNSMQKVRRFIERVENGETFQPPTKQRRTTRKPVEDMDEKVQTMYKLIYTLEDRYGDIKKAREDDPYLILLRKEVGS